MDVFEKLGDLVSLLRDTKVLCSLVESSILKFFTWFALKFENLFWIGFCNVLNRHASSWTEDESWASSSPVESQTQIHLLCDLDLFNQVDSVDWETIWGLLSDKRLPKHFRCDAFSFFSAVN